MYQLTSLTARPVISIQAPDRLFPTARHAYPPSSLDRPKQGAPAQSPSRRARMLCARIARRGLLGPMSGYPDIALVRDVWEVDTPRARAIRASETLTTRS
ncbi:hypothetical protein BD310DRAFT_912227 [Dichomitus squalens]|uniref:Uncharacterized protein n=1 Tax=Dichomitus squalens TaxID=114155 RepID=A0A4Q9QDT1_9APHY|nr:hypothetical protein BD310DRAFT_912227 [Dichomitus squalens]